MYPACILQDTRILMYLDVSQTYLTCSVKFQENTCILTFCMYFTRISNESKIHFGYTSDTSRYMYLERFLGVTLDTFHDTSGYVYLGFFITIHQDTPRYKITIHVSWTRHDDTSRYNQDTSRYMYLGRFVRSALDTHKILSRYNADTFRIRILGSFYLPCCPRSSRRSASSSLESGATCGAR